METCIYFAHQKDLGLYPPVFNISAKEYIEDIYSNK